MAVLIALGANSKGYQGPPAETLRWALGRLPQFQISVNCLSGLYETAPLGVAGQSAYVNAVAAVSTLLSPQALLRVLKRIERDAGRDTSPLRTQPRWNERPLDLDILDYRGRIFGRATAAGKASSERLPLVLPHPHVAVRPFVVRPLLDVAPRWHHPVTRRSAAQLWARLRHTEDGRILRKIG